MQFSIKDIIRKQRISKELVDGKRKAKKKQLRLAK